MTPVILSIVAHNVTTSKVVLPPGFVGVSRTVLLEYEALMLLGFALALIIPSYILFRLGTVGRTFLGRTRRLVLAFDPSGTYEFYPARLDSTGLRVDHRWFRGYVLPQQGSAYVHRSGPIIYPTDLVSGLAANVRMVNYANRLHDLATSPDSRALSEAERAALIGWRPLVIHYYAERTGEIREQLKRERAALGKQVEDLERRLKAREDELGKTKIEADLKNVSKAYEDASGELTLVRDDSAYAALGQRLEALDRQRAALEKKLVYIEEDLAPLRQALEQSSNRIREVEAALANVEKEFDRASKAAAIGNVKEFTEAEYQRMTKMLTTQPKEKIPLWVLGESVSLQEYAKYVLTGGTPANILQLIKHREESVRAEMKQENTKMGMIVLGIIAVMVLAIIALKVFGHA